MVSQVHFLSDFTLWFCIHLRFACNGPSPVVLTIFPYCFRRMARGWTPSMVPHPWRKKSFDSFTRTHLLLALSLHNISDFYSKVTFSFLSLYEDHRIGFPLFHSSVVNRPKRLLINWVFSSILTFWEVSWFPLMTARKKKFSSFIFMLWQLRYSYCIYGPFFIVYLGW